MNQRGGSRGPRSRLSDTRSSPLPEAPGAWSGSERAVGTRRSLEPSRWARHLIPHRQSTGDGRAVRPSRADLRQRAQPRRQSPERGDERRLGLPALAGNKGGANVSSASSRTFEDVKVGVRFKIAALWIAMLFLFAYGDIFGFLSPGQTQEVMAGELSGMAITEVFLFAVSLYIAIASVMVFLSLVLSPTVNRWTNIVLPSLYVVSIVASAIGETSAYYWFLSIAESALLLLIVWYAWRWPRRRETP